MLLLSQIVMHATLDKIIKIQCCVKLRLLNQNIVLQLNILHSTKYNLSHVDAHYRAKTSHQTNIF